MNDPGSEKQKEKILPGNQHGRVSFWVSRFVAIRFAILLSKHPIPACPDADSDFGGVFVGAHFRYDC